MGHKPASGTHPQMLKTKAAAWGWAPWSLNPDTGMDVVATPSGDGNAAHAPVIPPSCVSV